MPTPRPETEEILSAVENPGSKIICCRAWSDTSASGSRSPRFDRLLANAFKVQAAAIILDRDKDFAALLTGREAHRALFRFAGGAPILCGLQPMIH